jgi:hypothetical protein
MKIYLSSVTRMAINTDYFFPMITCVLVISAECFYKGLYATTEGILHRQWRMTFCRLGTSAVRTRNSGYKAASVGPLVLCPLSCCRLCMFQYPSTRRATSSILHFIPLCHRIVTLFFECHPFVSVFLNTLLSCPTLLHISESY